jgi:hypothetical protein
LLDKDFAAGDKFLAYSLAMYTATMLKKGESVYIDEFGGFMSGTVNVRRQGETQSYWTCSAAIDMSSYTP